MDIFSIIVICVFVVCLLWVILSIPFFLEEEHFCKTHNIISAVCGALFFVSVFIGIGITTEEERIYVAEYIAQKQTIELSLENENLTGMEKIQLVSTATELNGKFAKKKAKFNRWYFVVYDKTIYDGIELIDLKGVE